MRLTDEEARIAVLWDNLHQQEANIHERERLLEACLKSTVRELLIALEEDHDDKAVEDYISDWMTADTEQDIYDHIGR